jgi:nickel-dependent lactate racemase
MKRSIVSQNPEGLSFEEIRDALAAFLEPLDLKKVLIVPPDITRYYSKAGTITNIAWHMLTSRGVKVDIMPALGTHDPMREEECADMFGDIPFERFLVHDWRRDVVSLGSVPAETVSAFSEGLWNDPVEIEVNRAVMDPSYDLIFSVGQVVPHEVIGMANHSKNILVGLGGSRTINSSHMIGAVYGMEKMMGKDHTPVRKVLDEASRLFLSDRPIVYALTVTTAQGSLVRTHGLFIGDERAVLEEAVLLSQKKNITFLEEGIDTCVVTLDPKEFRSTWLGNKAIYRTRMAIRDGGNLIILAPGVTKFGEDARIDRLIRTYGYRGTDRVMDLFKKEKDLQDNMGVAAHLIHSSSDGRFSVTYAVKAISKEEIEAVGFIAADHDSMEKAYDVDNLREGMNIIDGKKVFFISNPALGLWIDKTRF